VLRPVVLDTDPQSLVTHVDPRDEVAVFVEHLDLRLWLRQARID
jgi:hypothetical protein